MLPLVQQLGASDQAAWRQLMALGQEIVDRVHVLLRQTAAGGAPSGLRVGRARRAVLEARGAVATPATEEAEGVAHAVAIEEQRDRRDRPDRRAGKPAR